MTTILSKFNRRQKLGIYFVLFVAVLGTGVYWFYATNKAAVVKIKYQGIEGLAILSKKEMEKLGDGIKSWSQKRTFHIDLLNSSPIESMQNKIKDEINQLEEKLEAVIDVSKSIWKKYQEGDTLRIKYLPDDPVNYVMLLE